VSKKKEKVIEKNESQNGRDVLGLFRKLINFNLTNKEISLELRFENTIH
jgi:hypothetical protein